MPADGLPAALRNRNIQLHVGETPVGRKASGVPNYARLVRGEVLAVKHEEYVEAVRSLGASSARIVFGTVLPNVISQVVVYTSYDMPVDPRSAQE